MRNAVAALAAAATVAAVTMTSPDRAEARCCWWGPGLIGGFAAGAVVGAAVARPYPYGYYGYYAPAPVYYDYYVPAPAFYGWGPGPAYGCWRWRHHHRYRAC